MFQRVVVEPAVAEGSIVKQGSGHLGFSVGTLVPDSSEKTNVEDQAGRKSQTHPCSDDGVRH